MAREAVCKFKISSLETPGVLDCLSGSPEQSALTRAKATDESDAGEGGKRTRGETKCKRHKRRPVT